MNRSIRTNLLAACLCVLVTLVAADCGPGGDEAPPQGMVVTSLLVSSKEYTADGGRYDLFLRTIPGEKIARLTHHDASPKLRLGGAIREPLFSHDGKSILFLADYSDSDDRRTTMTGASPFAHAFLNVWEARIAERKISPLTTGDFGWYVCGWSSNDRYVCATYLTQIRSLDQEGPVPEDVYSCDTRTRQRRRLARVPLGVDDAFWSHDGRSVLYQTGPNSNLYSVSRQGGKSKLLLRGKAGRYGYAFSPDGRKVAFVDTDGVYVAEANGANPKAIMKMASDKYSANSRKPQWSRDGAKLAILVRETATSAEVAVRLHVYDRVTRDVKTVATIRRSVSDPVWSRDGRWLVMKTVQSGVTAEPDPKTGWHTHRRDGLLAIPVSGGRAVTLKEPNEESKGLDWFEAPG